MTEITFVIPGETRGWERAAHAPAGTGKVRSFTPKKMRSDQAVIKHFAAQAMRGKKLMTGPVLLTIGIFKTYPKSWSKKKCLEATWITGKPDASNRLKQIEDAMNKVVFDDDAQIAFAQVYRLYGSENRVEVHAQELPDGARK